MRARVTVTVPSRGQDSLETDLAMTHVNDTSVNDEANTAFGGKEASGLGRFGGR